MSDTAPPASPTKAEPKGEDHPTAPAKEEASAPKDEHEKGAAPPTPDSEHEGSEADDSGDDEGDDDGDDAGDDDDDDDEDKDADGKDDNDPEKKAKREAKKARKAAAKAAGQGDAGGKPSGGAGAGAGAGQSRCYEKAGAGALTSSQTQQESIITRNLVRKRLLQMRLVKAILVARRPLAVLVSLVVIRIQRLVH